MNKRNQLKPKGKLISREALGKKQQKELARLQRRQFHTLTQEQMDRLKELNPRGLFGRSDVTPKRPATKPPIEVPLPTLAKARGGWVIITGDRRTHFTNEAVAKSTWRALDKQARALRRASLRREETEVERQLKHLRSQREALTAERNQITAQQEYLALERRAVQEIQGNLWRAETELMLKADDLRKREDQLKRPAMDYNKNVGSVPLPPTPGKRRIATPEEL